MKNLQTDRCGPGAADKEASNMKQQSLLAEIWSSELRCTCFIDPDDMEFKDTMEKRPQKVGVACGIRHDLQISKNWHGETCGENNSMSRRSNYACIVEAHESTRKHLGKTQQKEHEDRIAGKGVQFRNMDRFHKDSPY